MEVILEDDAGSDAVHCGFVLPCFFAKASVEHGFVGEDGSEALVERDERDSREAFLKRIHERAYLLHGSTVLA